MKKLFQLGLIAAVSLSSFLTKATEPEVMPLPSLPTKILRPDNLVDYPADCLEKSNEAYRILQMEEPGAEELRKGVALLIETAQAGDSYSLEKLANMALYGQYSIPKNIEWAINTFIYLIDNGAVGVWNTLNAIDPKAVELLESGKKEEARRLFIETWARTH